MPSKRIVFLSRNFEAKNSIWGQFQGENLCLEDSTPVPRGGSHPFTRHTLEFELPVAMNQRNPDKAKLKETILALREMGWSYRQIGREVGLHWTRVGQILKSSKNE